MFAQAVACGFVGGVQDGLLVRCYLKSNRAGQAATKIVTVTRCQHAATSTTRTRAYVGPSALSPQRCMLPDSHRSRWPRPAVWPGAHPFIAQLLPARDVLAPLFDRTCDGCRRCADSSGSSCKARLSAHRSAPAHRDPQRDTAILLDATGPTRPPVSRCLRRCSISSGSFLNAAFCDRGQHEHGSIRRERRHCVGSCGFAGIPPNTNTAALSRS